MIVDVVKIKIKAGKGGDGRVSLHREKFIPKGGPDGGDGGKGGDVVFVADHNMATLMDFKSRTLFGAEDGEQGGKKKMSGANGDDLSIKVPVGTQIYELKNGREVLIEDLDSPQKTYQAARGGFGGKGNYRFRSSTNQTPMQYTEGIPGEEKEIKLEIKLVADIGLVGAPNAGKSTLLNMLTKSNAKVADYPFTTLSPNLGTCRLKSGKTVVIADIPGLIEGASAGKGLGDDFLRHIERTRMLVKVIDPMTNIDSYLSGSGDLGNPEDSGDLRDASTQKEQNPFVLSAVDSYNMLTNELSSYSEKLGKKQSVVVINKIDLAEVSESLTEIKKVFRKKYGIEAIGISAATGKGREELLELLTGLMEVLPERAKFEVQKPVKIYTLSNLPNKRMVFRTRKVKTKDVNL